MVEDHTELRAGIVRFLRDRGLHVLEAGSAHEAIARLAPPPDLVVLDFCLPDGTAFSLLEALSSCAPAPIKIVLSGLATPEDAFRLARYGVHCYLQKPASLAALERAIQSALAERPDLHAILRASVGHAPLRDVQRDVREVMTREALAVARGNRSRAARLLQVSRQAVQQILRRAQRRPDGARRPPETP